MRVGLIGLGAIGRGVCDLVRARGDNLELVGALVAHPIRKRSDAAPTLCADLEQLLGLSPDVVVEAAGHEALRCLGPRVLEHGIDLLMVSVGARADPETERARTLAACAGRSRAVVVSGAIGALDAIASAAQGGLDSVTHTTRKPPRALLDTEEARQLRQPRELFRGSAREGALRFPESINVAAAVSLAGIGLDRTEVCVIADPGVDRNVHEVVARGSFGELRFEIRNIPSDDNPKTGRLVAMSVVHALKRHKAPLVVG
jgi:aspartate dehydrogenase